MRWGDHPVAQALKSNITVYGIYIGNVKWLKRVAQLAH